MLRLTELKLPLDHAADALRPALCQRLEITDNELIDFTIFRRSYDARKKSAITLIYTLDFTVRDEAALLTKLAVLTLPVVILASIYYYHQCQKLGTPIDLKVVGLLAAGFVIGGFFGGKIALSINQDVLKKIFAIILFYTALKMLNWDTMLVKWLRGIF